MEQIGRYQVTGELGRGAMGVVYRAEDPAIGRTVAIKTIRLGELSDPAERERLRERLIREARSAGILSHPGIVTIYDIHEEGDMAYVFMEFVDGKTLEQIASSNPLGKEQIFDVLRQTATALDYAHGKGIVHRDIKPANVMVSVDGQTKITDFGVAKILSQQMTQAGTIMGTPNYMSPEQIQGNPVDGRSDQFSLAVIAYEMLTGEKPYAADSLPTLLFKIVKEAPASPRRLNPTLSEDVETVIEKAFSKDPRERHGTCTEFVSALGLAVATNPDWQPQKPGSVSAMETVVSHAGPSPTIAESSTDQPPGEQVESTTENGETIGVAARRRLEREAESDRESSLVRNVLLVLATVLVVAGGIWAIRFMTEGIDSDPVATEMVQVPEAEAPPPASDHPSPATPPTGDTDPPEAPPTEAVAIAQQAASLAEASATPPEPAQVDPPKAATPNPPAPKVAPAKPKPKPQPPTVREHWVQVRSNPAGATVVADNNAELTCRTPCELPLAPGRHVLGLTLAGHRLSPRIIRVPEILDVTVNLDQEAGTLAVTSKPAGATITLNGEQQSEKTPAMLRLPIGTYKIALTLEGRPKFEDTVEVKDQVITNIGVDW